MTRGLYYGCSLCGNEYFHCHTYGRKVDLFKVVSLLPTALALFFRAAQEVYPWLRISALAGGLRQSSADNYELLNCTSDGHNLEYRLLLIEALPTYGLLRSCSVNVLFAILGGLDLIFI